MCTGFVSLLRFLAFSLICLQLPMSFIAYFMVNESGGGSTSSSNDVVVIVKGATPGDFVGSDREPLVGGGSSKAPDAAPGSYQGGYQSIGGELSS